MIVNVIIGILEKGTNERTTSMVFEHLDEVQHFFQEYGGVINRIEKYIDTDEDRKL